VAAAEDEPQSGVNVRAKRREGFAPASHKHLECPIAPAQRAQFLDYALAHEKSLAVSVGLLPLEHPHDLLIWMTVRLDMDAGPDAPPYDHRLVAGENATARP
jgi:hypothetical protein